MAIDLLSRTDGYDTLKAHKLHQIALVQYGSGRSPENMAIECETCGTVLVDFNRPTAQDRKAEQARRLKPALEVSRRLAADDAFGEANLGRGIKVTDSDGWETDGPDRLIRGFYYESPAPGDDSLKASYIVDFNPGTDQVVDAHANF
jgi:hypothetical protein